MNELLLAGLTNPLSLPHSLLFMDVSALTLAGSQSLRGRLETKSLTRTLDLLLLSVTSLSLVFIRSGEPGCVACWRLKVIEAPSENVPSTNMEQVCTFCSTLTDVFQALCWCRLIVLWLCLNYHHTHQCNQSLHISPPKKVRPAELDIKWLKPELWIMVNNCAPMCVFCRNLRASSGCVCVCVCVCVSAVAPAVCLSDTVHMCVQGWECVALTGGPQGLLEWRFSSQRNPPPPRQRACVHTQSAPVTQTAGLVPSKRRRHLLLEGGGGSDTLKLWHAQADIWSWIYTQKVPD